MSFRLVSMARIGLNSQIEGVKVRLDPALILTDRHRKQGSSWLRVMGALLDAKDESLP